MRHGPGRAAYTRAKSKITQYDAVAKRRGFLFVPFVLDTFGHFGAAARQFLLDVSSQLIAIQTDSAGPFANLYSTLVIAVATSLQRGNNICLQAAAHLATQQAARLAAQPAL